MIAAEWVIGVRRIRRGMEMQVRNRNVVWGGGKTDLLVSVLVVVQLVLVFFMQKPVVINMDGIFSYTLSNNPYDYLFIDAAYETFPENNGWIDAHILRENYVVETYDRFQYAAVYLHQRCDVHPPLYYFAVHTISSLFPGTYSNMYTLSVNLFALLLADIIFIRLFKLLYGSSGYGIVPIFFLMSMEAMRFLLTWARMYMLLFAFCAWYLYIHARLLRFRFHRTDLLQMAACIILGTLTHYYFYVYAGMLTLLVIFNLMRRRQGRELLRYLYFGIIGIMTSWILYPWVLFHIFLNDQNKHTNLEGWSVEKGKAYADFLKKELFHDRIWGCLLFLVIWIAGAFLLKKAGEKEKGEAEWKPVFRRIIAGSGLVYSLIIYTLDGGVLYYFTAFYMAFIVWASMVILDLSVKIPVSCKKHAVRIGVALLGVWIVCSGTVMSRYLSNARKVAGNLYQGLPLTDAFWQMPERYQNYNCLYIEEQQDGLFHNYFFLFGEYRQFKKISLEEFTLHGIRREDLLGCAEGGDGIVVYAPKACELDERDYRRIAGDNSYDVYEYIGGDFS